MGGEGVVYLHEGDKVEVADDHDTLRIMRLDGPIQGQRVVWRMRGRATTTLSTDQLMELFRGE
jgi:hypothetical protein